MKNRDAAVPNAGKKTDVTPNNTNHQIVSEQFERLKRAEEKESLEFRVQRKRTRNLELATCNLFHSAIWHFEKQNALFLRVYLHEKDSSVASDPGFKTKAIKMKGHHLSRTGDARSTRDLLK